jgi:hypothetical protein
MKVHAIVPCAAVLLCAGATARSAGSPGYSADGSALPLRTMVDELF